MQPILSMASEVMTEVLSKHDLDGLIGHSVPRHFQPGFVVLSFFITYVGTWTSLELINRTTSMLGYANWLTLAGASVCLGGVSYWCMHFVGNHAIVLGHGEPELQIVYSAGYTTLSFFVPIIVVFIGFGTVGSNERVSAPRVVLGGTLVGLGLSDMHYLSQASISNYDCAYDIAYVIPAILEAIVASMGTLWLFFAFRSSWKFVWWKRVLCAFLLAITVFLMYWLALMGTTYHLRTIEKSATSKFLGLLTVIVPVALAIVACLGLFLSVYIAQRGVSQADKRAQQFVVAAVVFDSAGKMLVSHDGLLPLRKITNAWLERTMIDVFGVAHPVFLWMFRTSHNWSGVKKLIYGMKTHVRRAGFRGRLGSKSDENLQDAQGVPIEDYSLIFRELFCLAAAELAENLNQPLEKIGVLYDEILTTGHDRKRVSKQKKKEAAAKSSIADPENTGAGVLDLGKGQLLFLVSRVDKRDAMHLQGGGFRFALPIFVLPRLALSLQIGVSSLKRQIESMKDYVTEPRMLEPGVHFAVFAVQASLIAGRGGFNVLVRKDAKNQLPTMRINILKLEDWHLEYIRKMENMSLLQCIKILCKASRATNSNKDEQGLAVHLLAALEALKDEVFDSIINESLLVSTPITAPCQGERSSTSPGTAQLIVFKTVLPLHTRAPSKKLELMPLDFVKACQRVYSKSRDHEILAKQTLRDFAPLLSANGSPDGRASPKFPATNSYRGSGSDMGAESPMSFGNLTRPGVSPSGSSRSRFWDRHSRHRNESEPDTGAHELDIKERTSVGDDHLTTNVMRDVKNGSPTKSQFLRVEIPTLNNPIITRYPSQSSAEEEEEEEPTYIDELFKTTIENRLF